MEKLSMLSAAGQHAERFIHQWGQALPLQVAALRFSHKKGCKAAF